MQIDRPGRLHHVALAAAPPTAGPVSVEVQTSPPRTHPPTLAQPCNGQRGRSTGPVNSPAAPHGVAKPKQPHQTSRESARATGDGKTSQASANDELGRPAADRLTAFHSDTGSGGSSGGGGGGRGTVQSPAKQVRSVVRHARRLQMGSGRPSGNGAALSAHRVTAEDAGHRPATAGPDLPQPTQPRETSQTRRLTPRESRGNAARGGGD